MRNRALTILTGLMLVAAAGLVNCGQKATEAAKTSMMVVYTTGDSYILAEGKTEAPAKVGMVVRQNDIIRTENGTVDLQTRGGTAVRIREMTRITIAALTAKGEAKLDMERGGLLANVPKNTKDEKFSVSTPTAIAGVRGTTFSVDVGADSRSTVRVMDGAVAMSPRVPALEKMDQAQVQADPNLQKLAALQQTQVVLEKDTQGSLDANLEKNLLQANTVLASSQPAPAQLNTVAEQASQSAKPVETQKVEFSSREVLEARTLVAVEPSIMEQAVRGDANVAQNITQKREQASEQVLSQIMDDASRSKLNSEQEIQQHYNTRLELIVLKNGDKIRGAVIAQTGNTIVVQWSEGVKWMPSADLEYLEALF